MAGFLANLRARYGHERVVDVFQGTGMEPKARELNIGGYVVRGVLPSEKIAEWQKDLEDSLCRIANSHGTRAVELKGKSVLWYRTIQCTTGSCTCKYFYEGTARNPVFKTERVAPFKPVCDWLHDEHKVPRQEHFNEIVANIYSRPKNQSIGAHTDQNPLLGETSDILSLSMGAAGVFFWHPSLTGQLRGWNAKEAARHATERAEGLWGCVPLLPGDLFLASGTFQHHLLHGSLSYTDAANVHEVISQWSMCSEALSVLHSAAYQAYFDNSTPQEDRSVITFRKNANHFPDCGAFRRTFRRIENHYTVMPPGPAAPPPPPRPQPVPEPVAPPGQGAEPPSSGV